MAESQAAAAAAAACVNRQCSPLLLQCGMSCTAGADGVPSRHVDYNLTRQAKRKNGPFIVPNTHLDQMLCVRGYALPTRGPGDVAAILL